MYRTGKNRADALSVVCSTKMTQESCEFSYGSMKSKCMWATGNDYDLCVENKANLKTLCEMEPVKYGCPITAASLPSASRL